MVGGISALSRDARVGAVTGPVEAVAGGARLRIWVVPGASRDEIVGWHGNRLKVRTTAPPAGGRANRAVARLLEDALGREVVLVVGAGSRSKVFLVEGLTAEQVLGNLGQ